MEISSLPNKEFKAMVIKMFTEPGERIEEHSGNFNKELENIKKNQLEQKNVLTEMKNTLEGINSRLGDTQEWISNLEERIVEITQSEQVKRKK